MSVRPRIASLAVISVLLSGVSILPPYGILFGALAVASGSVPADKSEIA
jgi:hypothetical protein